MALTPKESAFVDAYDGNGVDACRKAGYAGNEKTLAVQSSRLLRKANVREALDARQKAQRSGLIADRQERQEFWTAAMKDPGGEMRDRLKASELLGRSEADFIDTTRLTDPSGGPLKVSYVIDLGGKK